MCMCVCVNVSDCVCICLYMYVYLCECLDCVCVCLCVYMWGFVSWNNTLHEILYNTNYTTLFEHNAHEYYSEQNFVWLGQGQSQILPTRNSSHIISRDSMACMRFAAMSKWHGKIYGKSQKGRVLIVWNTIGMLMPFHKTLVPALCSLLKEAQPTVQSATQMITCT